MQKRNKIIDFDTPHTCVDYSMNRQQSRAILIIKLWIECTQSKRIYSAVLISQQQIVISLPYF